MDTAKELHEITKADPDDRSRLVDDFLRRRDPTFRRLGSQFATGYDDASIRDDLTNIVRLAAKGLVDDCILGSVVIDTIVSFEGFVAYRAKRPVNEFVDRHFSSTSRTSGRQQRRRELARTRQQLTVEWRREPTDQEVVDATNARLAAQRSDPTKQGMVCCLDDLRDDPHPADIDTGPDVAAPEPEETSDAALTAVEMREVADLTVAAAYESGTTLGAVAELWFAPYLVGGDGRPPSAAFIARELGVSASGARAKVKAVRCITTAITAERFGVDGMDGGT